MLLNLKQKQRDTLKLPKNFIGVSPVIAFDPLTLASYFGGFLMNYTTDAVPGTIEPVAASRNWYSTTDLTGATKKLNKQMNTTVDVVNGFTCVSFITSSSSRYTNTTTDFMTGITDFSFVVGFKKALPAANSFLISIKNNPDTIFFFLQLTTASKLVLSANSSGNVMSATSVNNYADDTWHACVCVCDQTNKTLTLYTDQSEVVSGSNALFVPGVMTPSNSLDFQLGIYSPTTSAPYYPGLMGDLLFFNTALSSIDANKVLAWEKIRLGI